MTHAAGQIENRPRRIAQKPREREGGEVPQLAEPIREIVERLGAGVAAVIEIHDVDRRERRALANTGKSASRIRAYGQDESCDRLLAPFRRALRPAR